MSFFRAASLTAALALLVSAIGGSIPLAGQAGAPAGDRRIEQYRGRRVIAGEVLVRFRSVPAAQSLASLDLADNERLSGGVRRLRTRRGGVATLITALAARPDVEFVEPNYVIEPAAVPSDPYFPYQTGLFNAAHPGSDLHATAAWDLATGSRIGVVALIDSGVDYNHPDLIDNVWSAPAPFTVNIAGRDITCPAGTHGFDAIALTCDPMDDFGHGTAMAGIIGASGNNGTGVSGVNWTTGLLPIKFIDAAGVGSYGDAIRAIDFAIQISDVFGGPANVRVILASWRGMAPSVALADAVERANAHDMLLVAAAGNDGVDIDTAPVYPAGFDSTNVLAVAATTPDDVREGYSNYGALSIDVAAPGATYTTLRGGGYGVVAGTSASAALVAGAASLVLSRCGLTTPQLKSILLGTVDAIAAIGATTLAGGRVNLERAVIACSGTNLTPSVSLVRPESNMSFVDGDAIEIEADAFDADGAIRSVDFFVGSIWLGRDSSAPFVLAAGAWPAGIYRVTAVATDNSGASVTSAPVVVTVHASAFTVPLPWRQQDIGSPGAAGEASGTMSSMTVTGAGADVWGTADAFTYVYQPMTGDGELVARVASVEFVEAWTKAGVMLRETLSPDSAHAFMLVSAGKGVAYQRRLTAGAASVHTSGGADTAPAWVRLTRTGQTITAAMSLDGSAWTVVGSDTVEWSSTIYAGIAVTSHRAGVAASALVDSITLTRASAPGPTPLALPRDWRDLDIGAVGTTGSALHAGGVFTLTGGGADIWGTADAFHFAYTAMTGDGEVIARVASLEGAASWTKAGVMIRATLDPESPYAFALVSVAKGAAFQRRSDAGSSSTHTDGGPMTAPIWLRLVRFGETVTASTSLDGLAWNTIGSDTIALGASVFVGLAVSSHDPTRTATAVFDQVAVSAFTSPPEVAPNPPLPFGWSAADVGAVGVPGNAGENGGALTISGAGADVWGTADAFHFAYTILTGNGSITAHVASVEFVRSWTKAGVMLRQSLDPGSPYAFSLVSAGKGQAFQRRTMAGVASTNTPGPFVTAPQWVRLTRAGNIVTALTSSDGIFWTVVDSDVLDFTGPVYAGLAVSSHDASVSARAVFTDVRIVP